MSLNKIFSFLSIGILIGIFSSNLIDIFSYQLYFFGFVSFLSLVILFFMKKYHFFVLVLVGGIFIGGIYSQYNKSIIETKQSKIDFIAQKNISIKGEVDYLYKKTISYKSYVVKSKEKNLKSISFIIKTPLSIDLNNGDILKIEGKVKKIENFSTNFNYIRFLQSKNIFFQIDFGKIEIIKINNDTSFLGKIKDFKKQVLKNISEIFPKDEGALLSGILLGYSDFSQELEDSYSNSGLTHLVAVSGFNITILIVFLGYIFKFFGIYLKVFLTTFFVLLFGILVGDSPSVIRACIMGLLGYYIVIGGRKADNFVVLIFTCLIMCLYNPFYINYDISFQLSFLAVLGLFYVKNFWDEVFYFLPNFFSIRDSFVLTMAAMTTTLPIMVLNFGKLPIFSPIANMLVGGIMPIGMFLGFITLIFSHINEKIGYYLGFLEYFLLKFVNEVARFFGNLSFGIININLGEYSFYAEFVYFLVLIFLILYFNGEKKSQNENNI